MHRAEESRQKRQSRIESEIGLLCYERFRLCLQIDTAQSRLEEIDRLVAGHESALQESEATRRDLATQAAIDAAKAADNKEA